MGNDPLNELLDRLEHVTGPNGGRYMARCPAHDDIKNSLQVKRGDNGGVLIKCFAGCPVESVVGALGMEMSGIMPPKVDRPERRVDYGTTVETYSYRDEKGALLFTVRRTSTKQFPAFKPDGSSGIGGVRRVLYRLPELLASESRTVFVVEGEKDVERLRANGLTATCNPGGAGKWHDEYSPFLQDKNVIIFADNDKAGEEHAAQVALSVHHFARKVKIVKLRGLPEKGDVSDWFDAQNRVEDLRIEIELTPVYMVPEALPPAPTPPDPWTPVPANGLVADSEAIEWLWEGYVAKEMITIFPSVWKSGKSTLLAYLFKAMTPSSDGSKEWNYDVMAGIGVAQSKVLVVTEEVARHWIDRRNYLHLGDHIHFIVQPFMGTATKVEWARLMEHIAALVVSNEYDLVVIDSLHNMWPVKSEIDNAELNVTLAPLRLITKAGAAVLLMAHPSQREKGVGSAARGGGALSAFVDFIVEMRYYKDDPTDTRREITFKGRSDVALPKIVVDFVREKGYDRVE